MSKKIDDLLAVLDLPEDKQEEWVWDKFYDGVPPLGWTSCADLAFRLNGGSLAGKLPIKWTIDALITEELGGISGDQSNGKK